MSPSLNLRKSLACVLMVSWIVTGLLIISTRQSYALNKSLPSSLTPRVNKSSEETGPQAKTVDEATQKRASTAYGKLPLSFEENRGQVDTEVRYISRGAGYTLFLTPTEAVLALQRNEGESRRQRVEHRQRLVSPSSPHPTHTSVLRMKLSGANPSPAVSGEREMGVRTNYFKGNDPQKWQTGVAQYERVRYAQVYPGIDVIYYGEQQQLEYDFEVAPGADARQIALEFAGVKRVKVERKTGDLILKTAGGEVRQHKPVAYQEVGGERREVESRYVMQGMGKVGVEVGEYDCTRRLVIDPVLSYSTYLGGDYHDFGQAIAVDSAGNIYVTGFTFSSDFPTKNRLPDIDPIPADAFVTKLNPNLSGAAALLYSTYLGGNDSDWGYAIAVDSAGIAYVTGFTWSSDFPTLHQYQVKQGNYSHYDLFVTKLDTNLAGAAALRYSTCLGGSLDEGGTGIAVDAAGKVYVTGYTSSTNFPVINQYQTDQPFGDAFVTKLDTNLSGAASLLYSTYLGGIREDIGYAVAVDSAGIAYATGYTQSSDFPTLNEFQIKQGGARGYDAFVTKLNTNLSGAASLLYSTYLGGSGYEEGHGVAVDPSGIAYVTGWTGSDDFPLLNQYQTHQSYGDAFVTKLDTNAAGAAALLYSTYLGGNFNDDSFAIAVDSAGNAYITGYTFSSDFPTLNELQPYQGGLDQYPSHLDAFVTKLDTNLSGAASLRYSTYLGGDFDEFGFGIAVDSSNNAYVTGFTTSTNFPKLHQLNRRQTASYGEPHAFVTKLTDSYTISGRVTSDGTTGINGVIVKLSGSKTGTIITNSTGNYSFAGLVVGGNYTVTPNRSGLTFIPSEQSFNDLQADQTNVNLTTRPANISGHVTLDTATGAGVPGVTITLTGGAGFTPRTLKTAGNGTYSLHNLPTPGNYKLAPSKTGYRFRPTQLILHTLTEDQPDQNFIATPQTYTISGVVKLGAAGLSGVTVRLTSQTPAGFSAQTTMTNSTGAYSFTLVPADRDYTLTATKPGYRITPANTSLTDLSANQTAVNFTVEVYSIRGRIRRNSINTGIGQVTVTVRSLSPGGFAERTVRTDDAGIYTFESLPAGRNYTIKPVKSGFTFTPAMRSITSLNANIPAGVSTNFTGTGP